MGEYKVVKYTSQFYNEWNQFVEESKNATFLFHRDFMEYHIDRFQDFSLLIFKNEKLVSILPANKLDDNVFSHNGLSYGGFVLSKKVSFSDTLNAFQAMLNFLKDFGVKTLSLKLLPKIYNKLPSDEIDYILFKLNAQLFRRDITTTIDQTVQLNLKSSNRLRNLNKAIAKGIVVKEAKDFNDFWNLILTPNLKAKYGVSPVHSLDEIELLKNKFPNNIKQFNAYIDGSIVAGVTVFETKNVAHAQYISKDNKKVSEGGLDIIFDFLINKAYQDKKFFDFGISNEKEGRFVNGGLQAWKESFGGRSVSHDFYKINVDNCYLLDNVFL
ncbi:GNAT family N-acetyltransferase [Tamlana flava]|uniref:GNAT family N-acetyltransferase n=1 Tax=Tamlana flava TaxID=3158572 RepID=UPI00351B7A98